MPIQEWKVRHSVVQTFFVGLSLSRSSSEGSPALAYHRLPRTIGALGQITDSFNKVAVPANQATLHTVKKEPL